MFTHAATVFDRGEDGVYVESSAFTDMGVLVSAPPYARVRPDKREELLWITVRQALESSGKRVPHPESWDGPFPLGQLAGCKNWKAFAEGASYCMVCIEGDEIRFSSGEWDGRGFGPGDLPETSLPADSSEVDLLARLNEYLGYGE